MELLIRFPGGDRVDATFGPFTVATDQPQNGGGEGSAPTPFALFLASLGTCAGIYVLGYCIKRDLTTEGIQILERVHTNPESGMVEKIDLEIQVPPSFPEKYHAALVHSAELCKVKKHLEHPPSFNVYTQVK